MNQFMNSVKNKVRQPEYTGANRCAPCTIVNITIAVVLAGGVAVVSIPLAVGVLAGSLVIIYLRGYLVPGTPTLTKQYFPASVLELFGKQPSSNHEFAPEPVLQDGDVVEECEDKSDLCLTDDFRSSWHRELKKQDDAETIQRVESFLEIQDATIEDTENGCMVSDGGEPLMLRESQAALTADLAALPELRKRCERWEELSRSSKSDCLSGLRVFLDVCPDCGATLEFTTETVESCCSSGEVTALNCPQCDVPLVEVTQ